MSISVKTLWVPAALVVLVAASAVQAGTLENLERERAILVETMLSPSVTPEQRADKVAQEKQRLVDLERMVLRDDSLTGNTRPVVRKAFENYDLTFLVHASVEKKVSLLDQWLDQVGVSTHSLMNARMGRR